MLLGILLGMLLGMIQRHVPRLGPVVSASHRQPPPHFAADACRTGRPMWTWQQGWSVVSCQTAHGFADCFVGFVVVVVVVFSGTVSAVDL